MQLYSMEETYINLHQHLKLVQFFSTVHVSGVCVRGVILCLTTAHAAADYNISGLGQK